MKSITVTILLIFPFFCRLVNAQIVVYPKDLIYPSEIVLNINHGKVNLGQSRMWNDAILTVENNEIFKGWSSSTFDLLYTYNEGKLYLGDSDFAFDVLYTFKNGKIYRGDGTFMMDQIFSYKDGKFYQGNQESYFYLILTIDGQPTATEIFAILFALEFL